MNFPICGADLFNLIPQRPPILMVEALLFSSPQETITNFYIDESCIFLKNDELSEFGLIENMAQSAAAMNGINDYLNNIPPRLGFIGEIKDFVLHKHPLVGQTIQTSIKIIAVADNVLLIAGKIQPLNQDDILAETKLKIFIQNAS